MKNAWGSSNGLPDFSLKKIAKINIADILQLKSSLPLAKRIRDYILKSEFGYAESDISSFNLKYPNEIVIEDTRNPNKWATDSQVRNWRAEKDGLVYIVLESVWVKNVQDFLLQRIEMEIFKASIYITDAEIRQNFCFDLQNILSSFGQNRIQSLNNVMLLLNGLPKSRAEIYKSINFLINQSGYKRNPFLMIVSAAATSFRSSELSFGSNKTNQSTIDDAVRITNKQLYNSYSKNALVKINYLEAAEINYWASRLYDEINANNRATNRRWIERMLKMSDTERSSLEEGDIFPIYDPTQKSMRGDFPSESRLKKANQDFTRQLKEWAVNDKIGKDQSFDLKGDHRQTEYFQGRSTTTDPSNSTNPLLQDDSYVSGGKWEKAKKPRGKNTGYSPKLKYTERSKSVYSNVDVDGVSAPVSLYLEYAKWWTAHQRMKIITDYLFRKELLEAKVRADNLHIVPPRPEIIEQYIKEFRRDGRIAINRHQKTKIYGILSELERLMEESNAFYRSR